MFFAWFLCLFGAPTFLGGCNRGTRSCFGSMSTEEAEKETKKEWKISVM